MSLIIAPTNCPSCDSELEWVKDQLFCRNRDCSAQSTKKLQHFCKKLKIKGFGEKTLEKLDLISICDLLNYTTDYGLACGLGDKTATNLSNEVDRIRKNGIVVNDFISALSIPLVGDGVTRKITDSTIEEISYESLRAVGVGDKASTNLINWIGLDWKDIRTEFPDLIRVNIKKPTIITKGDVCITGKLIDFKSRTLAAQHLESLGWVVKKSVTKSVKYLISEDGNTANSSYKKALGNNTEILTIKNLEDKYE